MVPVRPVTRAVGMAKGKALRDARPGGSNSWNVQSTRKERAGQSSPRSRPGSFGSVLLNTLMEPYFLFQMIKEGPAVANTD